MLSIVHHSIVCELWSADRTKLVQIKIKNQKMKSENLKKKRHLGFCTDHFLSSRPMTRRMRHTLVVAAGQLQS